MSQTHFVKQKKKLYLVEGSREKRIKQILMYERHAEYTARKLKPLKHMLLKRAHRTNLHRVHVRRRILEQAVVGIEKLARQQVEELTCRTPIVETLFSMEANEDLVLAQIVFAQLHEFDACVIQQLVTSDHDLGLLRALAVAFWLELAVEVAQFGLKAALIVASVVLAVVLTSRLNGREYGRVRCGSSSVRNGSSGGSSCGTRRSGLGKYIKKENNSINFLFILFFEKYSVELCKKRFVFWS